VWNPIGSTLALACFCMSSLDIFASSRAPNPQPINHPKAVSGRRGVNFSALFPYLPQRGGLFWSCAPAAYTKDGERDKRRRLLAHTHTHTVSRVALIFSICPSNAPYLSLSLLLDQQFQVAVLIVSEMTIVVRCVFASALHNWTKGLVGCRVSCPRLLIHSFILVLYTREQKGRIHKTRGQRERGQRQKSIGWSSTRRAAILVRQYASH